MADNITKLAIRKFSRDAIPSGGGLADGIRALADPNMANKMKSCVKWAKDAVQAVRDAPAPNPYRHQSDEEIAAVIIQKIEEGARATKPLAPPDQEGD